MNSEKYHYESGAIHNDHHREVNIGSVSEKTLGTIMRQFFKNDAEDVNFEEVYEGTPQVTVKKNPAGGKSKKQPKTEKPRVTITFKRKGQVTDGHLTLIWSKLLKERWVDGNEADFKALFSGAMDEDCILTWKKAFGKSTLVELFKQMVETGLVVVPDGFSIPAILQGHFKDDAGAWLTGLDKGDKPNSKGIPVIVWCVRVLKATPQSLMSGGLADEDAFASEYDPYDHQDMQYHQR